MSTLISWLIAGIKLLVQIIVITWATLAIYFSNLPLPAPRLGLTLAVAVMLPAFIEGNHVAHSGRPQLRLPQPQRFHGAL
jgi:hypothetical protein